MRQPNQAAISNTIKQVTAHRATLSRNKSAPVDANPETAARRTGKTDLGKRGGK